MLEEMHVVQMALGNGDCLKRCSEFVYTFNDS